MRLSKYFVLGMVLLCSFAILSGCTNPTDSNSDDFNNEANIQYATYESNTPLGEGDGALLNGILRQKNSCIVVETEDGAEVLPIFHYDLT